MQDEEIQNAMLEHFYTYKAEPSNETYDQFSATETDQTVDNEAVDERR